MRVNHISKLKNIPTVCDNIRFASRKEGERYKQLKLMLKAGAIKDLTLQPRIELQAPFVDNEFKRHKAIFYIGDFSYYDNELKLVVIEDVKGCKTQVYSIKKKMLLKKLSLNGRAVFREIL